VFGLGGCYLFWEGSSVWFYWFLLSSSMMCLVLECFENVRMVVTVMLCLIIWGLFESVC